jgi:hypothetical protein
MNIFFLHKHPVIAAQMQCDKHVVKMVLETAQMLSTAARAQGHDVGYKSAYPKHPMTLWVNQNADNFRWAWLHGMSLAKEYTNRYDKIHKSQEILEQLENYATGDEAHITEPPQCMPDQYKTNDYVTAYRNYYVGDKKRFAKYKNCKTPKFMQ